MCIENIFLGLFIEISKYREQKCHVCNGPKRVYIIKRVTDQLLSSLNRFWRIISNLASSIANNPSLFFPSVMLHMNQMPITMVKEMVQVENS